MQKNSNQHQRVSARIEKSKNYSLKKTHKIKTKDTLCFQGHNPWMENHQEVNPLTATTYPAFFLSLYNLTSTCIFPILLFILFLRC